ncbi:MAG TPA: hypothetical protein VF178_08555 [Gemmatimonadaceae bacterium]
MSPPPGPQGGLATPATGSIRLAGEHFAAATFYLLAGSLGLIWIAPELAAGNYFSPRVAGITHLFTLGWITTTIFGALHQLLPVALGAPIRWPRLGHASFWTFAPGAGLFACGVAESSMVLNHAGIALVGIGVVLAVSNIAATLPRARSRDVTWAAIGLAVTFLASTLVLGVVLLHNLHTSFIAGARVRVLATHLHVAMIGWVLMMMVGVAHRLLPMFLLAHGADTRWTGRALTFLAIGVPVLAVGLILPSRPLVWAALVLLEFGVACFLRQAYAFYRVRVRKRIDIGMRFAGTGLLFLIAACLLAPIVLAQGVAATHLATAYVLVGLLGGIVMFVAGFFYKIVPLLAWTARYRGQMSKAGSVPTVAQMYSARVAAVQLGLMAPGVLLLALSILLGIASGAYAGATMFFAGVLLFVTQLVRVARGGPFGGKA